MNMGEILIYQNQEGNIKIDVRLDEETVWLTQAQIALLFGKGRSTITEHIANVFKEGELDEKVVCRDFRLTSLHRIITNKLSKEAEIRLMIFFNNTIDPQEMAKYLRQVNYVLALVTLKQHETLQNEITYLENSFYWLKF